MSPGCAVMWPTRLGCGWRLAPASIAMRVPRPSRGVCATAGPVLLLMTAFLLLAQQATSDADQHRQDGSWSDAGELQTGREGGHTATTLDEGTVLLVGGGDVARSAEVWDPETRTSRLVSAPASGRVGHAATRLEDGRVLVAGGDAERENSASAEIYDPDEDAWEPAAPMAHSRTGHTATRLEDGRVLVAGGEDAAGEAVAAAELYDPDADAWQPAGSMSAAPMGHTATLLEDGRVLVAGGRDAAGERQATAELFDPIGSGAGDGWEPAAAMGTARTDPTASLLDDSQVLVVGGGDGDEAATVEAYRPDDDEWTACSADPGTPGCLDAQLEGHAASRLTDGTLLVVAAAGADDEFDAFRYAPKDGEWWPAAAPQGAYHGHTMTGLDEGGVLVAANLGDGFRGDAEVYSPDTRPAPQVTGVTPQTGSAGGGEEVVISGEHLDGAVFARFGDHRSSEVIVDSDERLRVRTPSAPPGEVAVTVTTPGGTSEPTDEASFTFEGGEGRWEPVDDEMAARRRRPATVVLDGPACEQATPPDYCGNVLLFGEDSSERYNPDTATFDAVADLPDEFSPSGLPAESLLVDGPVCRTDEPPQDCGTVLGIDGDGAAARYDPETNAWQLITPAPFEPSIGLRAVLLDGPDCDQPPAEAPKHCGTVLVVGSGQSPQAARYDPLADEWIEAASPAEPRSKYVMTLIDGDVCEGEQAPEACGQVLKASGVESIAGRARRMTTAELYDPAADEWRFTATDPPAGRELSAVMSLPDGRVVVAGGLVGFMGPSAEAEVFDPDGETWQPLESMPEPREGHGAVALADGRVLIAGGATQPAGGSGQSREIIDSVVIADPDEGSWAYAASMTAPRAGRQRGSPLPPFALQRLPDGQVLAAGGYPVHQRQGPVEGYGDRPLATAEVYEPETHDDQAGADQAASAAESRDDGGAGLWLASALALAAAAAVVAAALLRRRRHAPGVKERQS